MQFQIFKYMSFTISQAIPFLVQILREKESFPFELPKPAASKFSVRAKTSSDSLKWKSMFYDKDTCHFGDFQHAFCFGMSGSAALLCTFMGSSVNVIVAPISITISSFTNKSLLQDCYESLKSKSQGKSFKYPTACFFHVSPQNI